MQNQMLYMPQNNTPECQPWLKKCLWNGRVSIWRASLWEAVTSEVTNSSKAKKGSRTGGTADDQSCSYNTHEQWFSTVTSKDKSSVGKHRKFHSLCCEQFFNHFVVEFLKNLWTLCIHEDIMLAIGFVSSYRKQERQDGSEYPPATQWSLVSLHIMCGQELSSQFSGSVCLKSCKLYIVIKHGGLLSCTVLISSIVFWIYLSSRSLIKNENCKNECFNY